MGRTRGLFLAGVVGAMAGVYMMSMLNPKQERQVKQGTRRAMRGARSQMARVGTMYKTGRAAVDQGIKAMRS